MATCSNCGFDLGNRPPAHCPVCSALTAPASPADLLPEAPAFGEGETQALASATLFGVPPQLDDDDDGLLGDIGDGVFVPEVHRAVDRLPPGETPPLGEVIDYSDRELQLASTDEMELELDDPVPLSQRTAPNLDLLRIEPDLDDASLDLPLPAVRSRPPAVDLPSPARRGAAPALPSLPPPPPKRGGAEPPSARTSPPPLSRGTPPTPPPAAPRTTRDEHPQGLTPGSRPDAGAGKTASSPAKTPLFPSPIAAPTPGGRASAASTAQPFPAPPRGAVRPQGSGSPFPAPRDSFPPQSSSAREPPRVPTGRHTALGSSSSEPQRNPTGRHTVVPPIEPPRSPTGRHTALGTPSREPPRVPTGGHPTVGAVGAVGAPSREPPRVPTGRHAPVSSTSAAGWPAEAFDLPAPARPRAQAPSAPNLDFRHGPSGPDLLHGPSGPDLPRVGATPARARAHAPAIAEFDLPAPARTSAVTELDLPAPTHADALRPTGKTSRRVPLPVPELEPDPDPDLPEVDLLEPVDLDLPSPVSLELEPREIQDLTPAAQEIDSARDAVSLTPAAQELQPARSDALMPSAQELEPVGRRNRGTRQAPGTRTTGRHAALPPALPQATTSTAAPRKISRGLLYGGAVLILLTAAGSGVLASGALDPWIVGDADIAQSSISRPRSATNAPAAPSERSPAVLASLRADTPASYRAALDEAARTHDVVGQAEASLLLHHRYGPDLVRVGQARALLEPVANDPQPFVRRVLGLAALARGDLEAASTALVDTNDPRTMLYRAFLELARGQHDAVLATAQAILTADPSELAALELRHAALAARTPAAELAALEASVAAHPEHPGLRELLARTALASGHLHLAETHAKALDEGSEDEAAGYRVRVATLVGRIAAARGDHRGAIRAFDRALAADPSALEPALARVGALIEVGELSLAGDTVDALRKVHPKELSLALLEIDVSIAGGDGDAALARIGALEAQEPRSAELAYRVGKVQAMRMQVDEASTAFAAALEREPAFHRAIVAEAELWAAAHREREAIEKLAAAVESHGQIASILAEIEIAAAKIEASTLHFPEAIAALDRALAAVPTSNEAETLRGELKLRSGDTAGGLADLVAVFERTGGYPGVTGPLGRQFARERKLDELVRLVGDDADDPQASVDAKVVAGRLALLQEDAGKVKTLAEDVLSREPNNWEAHLLLAEAYRLERAYPEALEQIGQAKPAEPQAELHLLKGKLLEFNGRHDDARPEYQKALAIDPSLHEARFLYGRSLAYGRAARAAIEELTRVIDATGERYPEAWLSLGLAHKELGAYDQAIAAFGKAVELEPTLYEGWFYKGDVHRLRNQHAEAATAFEAAAVEATQAREWYPDALYGLGRARVYLGDKAGARAALQQYLDVAPANATSRAEAARLLRGLGA